MSFWSGIAKGLEAVEAKGERDRDRGDRLDARAEQSAAQMRAEAWQRSQQDYRAGQDRITNEYRASESEYARSQDTADAEFRDRQQTEIESQNTFTRRSASAAALSRSGTSRTNRTGTGGAGGTRGSATSTRPLAHTLQFFQEQGGSEEALTNFAQYGKTVVSQAFDAYTKHVESMTDGPGTPLSVDNFLATAMVATSEGEEPDWEKVAAQMGMTQTELNEPMSGEGGLTWKDTLRETLSGPKVSAVFNQQVAEPLDTTQVASLTSSASQGLSGSIEQMISVNNEQISKGFGDQNALGRSSAELSSALEKLDNGQPADAIRLAGPDAILSLMANAPGSVENHFGADWDNAIADRKFRSENELQLAIEDGRVNIGSYFVLDGGIHRLDFPSFTTEELDNASPEEVQRLKNLPALRVDGQIIYRNPSAPRSSPRPESRPTGSAGDDTLDVMSDAPQAPQGAPSSNAPNLPPLSRAGGTPPSREAPLTPRQEALIGKAPTVDTSVPAAPEAAPEVDTSEQDSMQLVNMMNDPNIDQEMLNEAIEAFQLRYGPGSASAAFDMIMNKGQ